jgi:excisionase family DNA binding protein
VSNILTVSGAAQALEIPEQTVRWLEKRGKLTAVRDSSGRRLFQRSDVERFARERDKKLHQAVARS